MIKLQLLLRHPGGDITLDPAVRALLEQHGFAVTGSGRATVSAQMEDARFEALFGPQPVIGALPVPAPLAEAITLITLPPRHSAMLYKPRVKHAAI
jgi:hypothetical protein